MLDLDQLFGAVPIMAILRGYGAEESLRLATTAWDLGLTCVEIPVQSPDDLEALRRAAAAGAERGVTVGAGTVVTPEQADVVAGAGAGFIVSPGYDPEVVAAATARGLAAVPGVATPSEVQLAARSGLRWLKAFPASVLGTSWFAAMRGPFPEINFVATGGMDAHNAGAYFDVGVKVVAVGSALADERQLPLLAELLQRRAAADTSASASA